AVAEGLPYDIREFPEIPAYLATYSYNRWNAPRRGNNPMIKATAAVLAGEVKAKGKLPVSIENINLSK
ncbi:MAG: hypothetical protein ABEI54_05185, partial [Candidatus Bipolaricaulia bacterium]